MTDEMIPYRFPSADDLKEMERDLIQRLGTLAPAGMNLDLGGSVGSYHNAQALMVCGEWYPTITTACVVHGVELATFLYRRTAGWTVEQALGREPPPERRDLELFEVKGVRCRGRAALAEAFGLKRATVVSRLKRGWTVEQAVGFVPPPARRRGTRGCRRTIDTHALSQQCGVPQSTLRHRIFQQGLSVAEAQYSGKRNGGHAVRFDHAGRRYSFRSLRQAAAYFGVVYVTVKRRLANGASIKQALGLLPLLSRRRHLAADAKQSRPRAKPITFLGAQYPSISDAARAQGCVTQQDINWFVGVVRDGLPEDEIVLRVRARLGFGSKNKWKP